MVVPDTGGETVQAAAEPENSAGKKIQRKAYFVPPLRVELSSFLIQKIYLSKLQLTLGAGLWCAISRQGITDASLRPACKHRNPNHPEAGPSINSAGDPHCPKDAVGTLPSPAPQTSGAAKR